MIVEDGTGVASADVYSTLDEFKAYTPRGGLSIPSGATDAQLEAALIRGTAFIEGTYAQRWMGIKATDTQGLSWPRIEAWDEDGFQLVGIPTGVKNACMEAALIEVNKPGELTEALERGGMLIRKKTGPLEKEWAPGAPVGKVYPAIKLCLSSIIHGYGRVRLSR